MEYVGDEVLYYILIRDEITLYTILQHISETIDELEKQTFPKYSNHNINVSVKATVWIAPVIDNNDVKNNDKYDKYDNISFNTEDYSDYRSIDFIGTEIDIGFRIAKYAVKKNIVVSAELAYLLSRMAIPKNSPDIKENLKIIDYKKLKGVWSERAYPIIWYYKDFSKINDNIDYDEHTNNDIVNNIKNNLCGDIIKLKEIFQVINKLYKVDKLLEILKSTNNKKNKNKIQNITKKFPELHLVAIVVFKNDSSIFITKRINRKILNDIYEFGCVKLGSNETFQDAIQIGYKNKFNIDISYINDRNIIDTYIVDKKDAGKHQGIIFYAEAETNENIKIKNKNKHKDIVFIKNKNENIDETLEEKGIKEENIVENAIPSINKIFNVYQKRKENNFK